MTCRGDHEGSVVFPSRPSRVGSGSMGRGGVCLLIICSIHHITGVVSGCKPVMLRRSQGFNCDPESPVPCWQWLNRVGVRCVYTRYFLRHASNNGFRVQACHALAIMRAQLCSRVARPASAVAQWVVVACVYKLCAVYIMSQEWSLAGCKPVTLRRLQRIPLCSQVDHPVVAVA